MKKDSDRVLKEEQLRQKAILLSRRKEQLSNIELELQKHEAQIKEIIHLFQEKKKSIG